MASACPGGEHSFDVAIVGGGITGLSAALHLSKAGVRVALLEAEGIGFGASGRSGGFIVPNLSRIDPDGMVEKLGDRGELLANTLGAAARTIFETVREEGINCAARAGGWYQPAATRKAMKVIEGRQRQWERRGFRVELLDQKETEKQTGCAGYLGSWRDPSGGTIHPLNFALGLAARAEAKGCIVWTGSPVSECRRTGGLWELSAGGATVRADFVLDCTNALNLGFNPAVERAVIPLRIFQFATTPLAESERQHLFQRGECLSDTGINLFTYRFDQHWRLVTGQIPVVEWGAHRFLSAWVARRLANKLSLSRIPEIEFTWDGLATITQDFLPRIFEVGSGFLSLTGCNGRGIAMSFQLGRGIAQYALDGKAKALPVPVTRPKPFRRRWLARVGARLYPVYGLIKDRWAD